MTDDATTTWLARLQALTVAERRALLREMSRHEVEAVLLRLMATAAACSHRGFWRFAGPAIICGEVQSHGAEWCPDCGAIRESDGWRLPRNAMTREPKRGWWARIWKGSKR